MEPLPVREQAFVTPLPGVEVLNAAGGTPDGQDRPMTTTLQESTGSPAADKILVLSQEFGRVVLCRKRMLCWDWEDAPTM
jgi:hypothetical protein